VQFGVPGGLFGTVGGTPGEAFEGLVTEETLAHEASELPNEMFVDAADTEDGFACNAAAFPNKKGAAAPAATGELLAGEDAALPNEKDAAAGDVGIAE